MVDFAPPLLPKTLLDFAIEDYLDCELDAETKHEFHNGTLIEMSGAMAPHNLVKGEVFFLLKDFFRAHNPSCTAWNSDHKIRIEVVDKFVYPDTSVHAGRPQFYVSPTGKLRTDAICNPVLIVEVLSEKTRKKDKNQKFDWYKTIPTFAEYLLIEPEFPWAEVHRMERGAWSVGQTCTDFSEQIVLKSIGCRLAMREIYKPVVDFGLM